MGGGGWSSIGGCSCSGARRTLLYREGICGAGAGGAVSVAMLCLLAEYAVRRARLGKQGAGADVPSPLHVRRARGRAAVHMQGQSSARERNDRPSGSVH